MAIEHARLYEQAQELAAVEERQRLARELHDSVSQALYGIALGVHAARTARDRAPSEVAEALDYVLPLAEGALAEMRALIFELRPESLATEGLVAALKKQALAHKYTLTIGRSHGIHAEPTTFGLKLAGHYAEFARHRARLVAAREEIAVAAVSGAPWRPLSRPSPAASTPTSSTSESPTNGVNTPIEFDPPPTHAITRCGRRPARSSTCARASSPITRCRSLTSAR